MNSPIPSAAIDATAPTSRATFRLVARCAGATNRDADTLRQALLARWSEHAGTDELVRRLQSLDDSDPDGARGVDARLVVWFSYGDASEGRLTDDDSLPDGLSDEFRSRLAEIARAASD